MNVLAVGFGHPESIQLLENLRRTVPQHSFTPQHEVDEAADAEPFNVAMIWCPRAADEALTLISDALADNLPVVAIMQGHDLPRVDFSVGHIEVVFLPTTPDEALSRIALVMARAHGPADKNLVTHGDLVIDQDRYEVRLAGAKVDLTYKEYELLKYIAARPGRVFSREALLRAVWDYDYFGGTRTVDVHVRRLRSKINDVRYQFIETVWNVGYRFRTSNDHDGDS